MGLFDWMKKKAVQRGVSYQIHNGQFISPADNKTAYITEGYTVNDLIYSIINLIADKVRVAPWGVYKVVKPSSLKAYKAILSKKNLSGEDLKRALELKDESMEEVEDSKLSPLLDTPDGFRTFSDLVADSSIMKLLTGDRMIWAELLEGGANTGKPQSLHILPSNLLTMKVLKEWPFKITGYEVTDWGLTKDKSITADQVLHDKYFNPLYDAQGGHLWGLSPLKAALLLTTKSNEANKTEAAQYQNQGPKKVVFVDDPREIDVATTQLQAQKVKSILQGKEYGGSENAGKIVFSGMKMGVVDAGLSPVELGIMESEQWSLRRFCNIYGVPSQLMNDPENKSYNNSKEGESALTMRCALPQLNSFREHFNRKLKTDWGFKDKDLIVDYDISVYTELQEDLKEKWGWVKELPVPWSYKLDMMGLDYEEGQDGLDEIMIPTGLQPIDGMNVVDEALNEENENSRVARGDR